MTLFQETASAQKPLTSNGALSAPFRYIMAGLVVLMAVAVASIALAGRTSDATIQGSADVEAIDGYMAGLIAAANMQRAAAAQELGDGWEAALVPHRTYTSVDGWEAGLTRPVSKPQGFAPGYPEHGGLAGPSRVAIDSVSIHRFLLPEDQAAEGGSSLRFAPQPAEPATDGYNQRFIHVD